MQIRYSPEGYDRPNSKPIGNYYIERRGQKYKVFYRGREDPPQLRLDLGASEVDRTLAQIVTRDAKSRAHTPKISFSDSVPEDKKENITSHIKEELTQVKNRLEERV